MHAYNKDLRPVGPAHKHTTWPWFGKLDFTHYPEKTVISEHGKGVPEAPRSKVLAYHNYKLLVRRAPDDGPVIVVWEGIIM